MAICYKKYKLERTFSDSRQDPANGKWFARTVVRRCRSVCDSRLSDTAQRRAA